MSLSEDAHGLPYLGWMEGDQSWHTTDARLHSFSSWTHSTEVHRVVLFLKEKTE